MRYMFCRKSQWQSDKQVLSSYLHQAIFDRYCFQFIWGFTQQVQSYVFNLFYAEASFCNIFSVHSQYRSRLLILIAHFISELQSDFLNYLKFQNKSSFTYPIICFYYRLKVALALMIINTTISQKPKNNQIKPWILTGAPFIFLLKLFCCNSAMPELPQVQTVRKFLASVCLLPKPKKLRTIKAFYPNIIKQTDPVDFINALIGQTFTDIDRYGKHLILKFQDYSIISHLRMEGKYIWYDKKYKQEKHDHIQFIFTDGNSIVYNDVRKFGTMHLVKRGEELTHPSISKLGPQVNNELTFTEQYLSQIVENRNKNIKEVLLNQELVCGIGNIYADEILFSSKVHPERSASKLSESQVKAIVKHGKTIIDRAIQNNGTTIRSFSTNHESGSNQFVLNVYGKEGEPCSVCNSAIKKIKVGGRGTHYCPKCQK